MPNNVGLYNVAASGFTDTFVIQDVINGGRIIAQPVIKGGETFYFNCAADDQGYGELNIRRLESTFVHFDFVRDSQILRL